MAAIVGSGLLSGLFFVFSNFAMRAFQEIEPAAGIRAMQQINITIINPLFMIVFMGAPLVSTYLVILAWSGALGVSGFWFILGGQIHIIGSFIVTVIFNVPLNNQLAVVDPDSQTGREMWKEYHAKWVPWNHVRTLSSVLSLIFFAVGLTVLL